MKNSSSTFTSIYKVPELEYHSIIQFIKQFGPIDGNTPETIIWLMLERINKIPPNIEAKQKTEKVENVPVEHEYTKKEIVELFKDKLGLEDIAKFMEENYKKEEFKEADWNKTEITEEVIKRLQGIREDLT